MGDTVTLEACLQQVQAMGVWLDSLPVSERVAALNAIREAIHEHSPFKAEPVDCVRWLPMDDVRANSYNPNSVAPPEMKLLALSIEADGYTQPIVGFQVEVGYEVVDGFHRHRVGREVSAIRDRVQGYLPVVRINTEREGRGDRMAATIRHNRARGKHSVTAMSDIVVDLVRRGWSDARVSRELGMDVDEVLRLKQVTGLAELFADVDFSQAWDVG